MYNLCPQYGADLSVMILILFKSSKGKEGIPQPAKNLQKYFKILI